MKALELLSPAGNLEKGKTAVRFGADAVYLGGTKFSLRAKAGNFSIGEMETMLAFAHRNSAKVYVTVNIIPHNQDLEGIEEYLRVLGEMGVDGIIAADPSVIMMAKEVAPHLPIHLSTQASMTNWRSARFWLDHGVRRIVLARELSLAEIREIHARVPVDLEAFVHGAMCISYSGRCLLSNYMTGRDANRGECVQACRFKYHLVEEKRPGQYMPIDEDEQGTYIMNSKDLCLVGQIPELAEAGVSSFKIEGRMKTVHYVAAVTRVYRQAIDKYLENPERYEVMPHWLEELAKISHRPYFPGFLFGRPGPEGQHYPSSKYIRTYDFVGVVTGAKAGKALVEVRNQLSVGDEVEAVNPGSDVERLVIRGMRNQLTDEYLSEAHANTKAIVDFGGYVPEPGAVIRRKAPEDGEDLPNPVN